MFPGYGILRVMAIYAFRRADQIQGKTKVECTGTFWPNLIVFGAIAGIWYRWGADAAAIALCGCVIAVVAIALLMLMVVIPMTAYWEREAAKYQEQLRNAKVKSR